MTRDDDGLPLLADLATQTEQAVPAYWVTVASLLR